MCDERQVTDLATGRYRLLYLAKVCEGLKGQQVDPSIRQSTNLLCERLASLGLLDLSERSKPLAQRTHSARDPDRLSGQRLGRPCDLDPGAVDLDHLVGQAVGGQS